MKRACLLVALITYQAAGFLILAWQGLQWGSALQLSHLVHSIAHEPEA